MTDTNQINSTSDVELIGELSDAADATKAALAAASR